MVEIGAAEGGPDGNVEPEGAMVTVESFVEFKMTATGVEKAV
jgi:hypothetical protein